MKVWILTSEHNDYDQPGEYFEAAFSNKPTIEQIKEIIGMNDEYCRFVLAGGGRKDKEYAWFWLREEECK